jgi:hypothetical protein
LDWIDAGAEQDVSLNATAGDLVIIAITADDDINLTTTTTTAGSITDGNGATNNLMGDAVNFKVGGAITDIEITIAMISGSETAPEMCRLRLNTTTLKIHINIILLNRYLLAIYQLSINRSLLFISASELKFRLALPSFDR